MAETPNPPPEKAAASASTDESPLFEPLTRANCKRLAATDQQIAGALSLAPAALNQRAACTDKDDADFLSAEALVYFIRRAHRLGDTKTSEALFKTLYERCAKYLRSQFRGFDQHTREDLRGDVMEKVIKDLFATDNRGDYMQVRFWTYLEKKAIDIYREAVKHRGKTESLDANISDESDSEGDTLLDRQTDNRLSPEEFAILSEGLKTLPPDLRNVFLLRHYVGMEVGSDNPADDKEGDTLARHYNVSGRTIRNRLRKADSLLSDFQEKKHGK